MHKILVPVERESGSISTNVITGSYPSTKKTLEAKSGFKSVPFSIRFYELDCLSEEEINSILNDPTKLSDCLKDLIEDKGFTFMRVLNPITRTVERGTSFKIDDSFLNDTSIPLPIKMQILASSYLEDIFGYWNVYEIDYERYQSVEGVSGDGGTDIDVFNSFDIKKLRIVDTNEAMIPEYLLSGVVGSPEGSPGSPDLSSKLRLKDQDGNILFEIDTIDAIGGEFDVDIRVDIDQKLTIECDDWYGQSYEIKTKHSIKY